MEQDNGKLYISKMSKAARKNKIFVDYLRNERDATAIAPYSSRARLGMAAALPLEWAELKAPKAPKFLIAQFAEWSDRLNKDPWKAMLSSKQEIPAKLFAE
jgi:bifunctional non-homologous end joining protein LigD